MIAARKYPDLFPDRDSERIVQELGEDYMMWWFRFLDERHDGFVLLVSCAENTRYANFQHDWVEKMTRSTYGYYREAFRRGLSCRSVAVLLLGVAMSVLPYWFAYQLILPLLGQAEMDAADEEVLHRAFFAAAIISSSVASGRPKQMLPRGEVF